MRSDHPRPWALIGCIGETLQVSGKDRILVNEALTIHPMLVSGVGVGCMPGYVRGPASWRPDERALVTERHTGRSSADFK